MLAKESSKNKPTPEWKVAARALSFTAQRCSARSKATGEWKEAARALLASAWDVFVEWHATGEHGECHGRWASLSNKCSTEGNATPEWT